ncbi:MAG TPA: glycine betaine ABC transporter substrate-binding protein [Micromonosporaceae bacterium]|nr:glycine betaine ABC transporter substrate-binding protein [Micromonosporaceae bacterium]
MRTSTRLAAGAAAFTLAALGIAGCGSKGSSGTAAPPPPPTTGASGEGCFGNAGSKLVVLEDDKHLQLSDNVVAAINDSANNPAVLAAVNAVSAALDTQKLIALNRMVDVDRHTPAAAAATFAQQNNITAGLAKGPGGNLKVGAANFSESEEIANLYKIALTAAGYKVTVQTIGNREIYEPQLEKNQIQIVPEYAATMADFLAKKQQGASAPEAASGDIDKTMSSLTDLGTKAHLVFGKPAAAVDTNAFAVTDVTAQRYNLKTLSDFAAKCSGPNTSLAGPAECPQRPFCQAGLQDTYGIHFGKFLSMSDAGGPVTKKAITDGVATIGLVFSSDSSLGG